MFSMLSKSLEKQLADCDALSENGTLTTKSSQRSLQTPSKPKSKSTKQRSNKSPVKKVTNKAQEIKKPVAIGPEISTQTEALESLNNRVGLTKMLMEQLNDSLTLDKPSRINDPDKIIDLSKYYQSSKISTKIATKTKPKASTGKSSRAKGGEESKISQDLFDFEKLKPVPSEELTAMKHDLLCNYKGKTIPIQRDPIKPEAIPKLQSRKKTPSVKSKKPKAGSTAGILNSTPSSTFPPNTNLPKTMTGAPAKDDCFEKLIKNPHTVKWVDVKKTEFDDFLEPEEFKKLDEKFKDITFEDLCAKVEEAPSPADK